MLTLGEAKLKLARYTAPEDAVDNINAACEALLTALNHKNSIEKVAFTVTDGLLTLPREYVTCLGITLDEAPTQIYSRWYEVISSGPGITETPCREVIDLGDGYCTAVDITSVAEDGSTVEVACEVAADAAAGNELLVRGLATDLTPIYTTRNGHRIEGEYVDIAVSPGTTSSNVFFSIKEVIKPVTQGRIYLLCGGELLATYFPNDVVPKYRRYRVPDNDEDRDVVALCLRRHVDLVSDTDVLPIENVNALRDALMSLTYRTQNDLERSNEYLASAVAFLNKEHKRTFPTGQYPPMINFPGHRPIPNLR